jgi:uncharacterized protein (TIGR04255 family)
VLGEGNSYLPTYDNPPLVEVAMSVQFDPPGRLNTAHLGAFWWTQRQEFPTVRVVQPIPAHPEDFTDEGQWLPPSLQLALSEEPLCRLQFSSADEQWLCQIQPDRLVVNWRKRNVAYPRFGETLSRCLKAWKIWCEFLAAEKLDRAVPKLWELTYVNRVPKEELWQQPSDWPNVFPGLWGGQSTAINGVQLRGLHGQWVWDRATPRARLYVEPRPARSSDNPPNELLMLSLTARGPVLAEPATPNPDSSRAITAGMNVGHELIVLTFDAINSDKAKLHWKRHDDSRL